MRLRRISIVLAIAALTFTNTAAGQTRDKKEPQGFIQIPEIAGTSSAPARKGWIDIMSLSGGFSSRTDTGPGRVMVRKLLDKSSPLIAKAFKEGTRFETVRLDVPDTANSRATYLKYELKNVQIVEYRVDGQIEYISLTYQRIDHERPPAPVAAPAR